MKAELPREVSEKELRGIMHRNALMEERLSALAVVVSKLADDQSRTNVVACTQALHALFSTHYEFMLRRAAAVSSLEAACANLIRAVAGQDVPILLVDPIKDVESCLSVARTALRRMVTQGEEVSKRDG